MDTIPACHTVSVTELTRDFASVLKAAGDEPVAVLMHNRPAAYLVPAAHYERLLAQLEDLQDMQLALARADGPFVNVTLDESCPSRG